MGRREDRDSINVGRKECGRVYVAYTELEEWSAGMWRPCSATATIGLMGESVALLRDAPRFAAILARVVREWPVSCVAEMTRPGNHLAWLGAAACCISHACPEPLTRRAWWKLTALEQAAANTVARRAEAVWWSERRPLLFGWEAR